MLENYSSLKKKTLAFTSKINGCPSVDQSLLQSSKMVSSKKSLEDGEFKIALIAPFSAGKSTFINALIGLDLLSMEITAETSVITKIRYSETRKVEIFYQNGKHEIIDAKKNPLTDDLMKSVLESKTTVKGDHTEDHIKEVCVYFPLDICKDNVEIVDTPGLFARHEKHHAITSEILPTVNAVIFMIDPESVGEEHFTEEIQKYVGNAEASNLEENGRHIFFVINKIDKFNNDDIEKAEKELNIVLKQVLPQPQIFKLSAYYAMKGKMYNNDRIPLIDMQKDKKIRIKDPEDHDFSIGGKGLTEDNISGVLNESRISEFEVAIGSYLHKKNYYLIENLHSDIHGFLKDNTSKYEFELQELNNHAIQDRRAYEQKLNSLNADINQIEDVFKRKLKQVTGRFYVGTSGGGGRVNSIQNTILNKKEDIIAQLRRSIQKSWREKRFSVNQNNGEDMIYSIISALQSELEIHAKSVSKESFKEIKATIQDVVKEIQRELNQLQRDLSSSEKRNIGKTIDNLGDFSMDTISRSLESSADHAFSSIVGSISDGFRQQANSAKSSAEYQVEKTGFFYKFFTFFGAKRKYIDKFDITKYKEALDGVIDELIDDISEEVNGAIEPIPILCHDALTSITNDVMKQSEGIVRQVVQTKRSVVTSIHASMSDTEEKNKIRIEKTKRAVKELQKLSNDFSTLLSYELKEEEVC